MYLVRGARGLVFPSLYEGFGLPVLEAMQCGCAVITSNGTSLPEVAGDAAHYVDPFSLSDLVSALERFSVDDEYVGSLEKKGHVQARKFSAEQHCARLREGYAMLFSH